MSNSELKSHTYSLEQLTSVAPGTTRSLVEEEATASDTDKVTPTIFKQPIINNNNNYSNYNSLHVIINTVLFCFLIVIVIFVLATGFSCTSISFMENITDH